MKYITNNNREVRMFNVNPSKYKSIFEEEKKAAKKEENGRRN